MIYCWINYHQSNHCLFLSVFVSVCLSLSLYLSWSICLSFYLSFSLSLSTSWSLSICLSFYLSVSLSVSVSVYLSLCLSFYLTVSLFVHCYLCIQKPSLLSRVEIGKLVGRLNTQTDGDIRTDVNMSLQTLSVDDTRPNSTIVNKR